MTRAAKPIAEVAFDLSYTHDKMGVRLYAPEPVAGSTDWACRSASAEAPRDRPNAYNPQKTPGR